MFKITRLHFPISKSHPRSPLQWFLLLPLVPGSLSPPPSAHCRQFRFVWSICVGDRAFVFLLCAPVLACFAFLVCRSTPCQPSIHALPSQDPSLLIRALLSLLSFSLSPLLLLLLFLFLFLPSSHSFSFSPSLSSLSFALPFFPFLLVSVPSLPLSP